jgi:hypothetical protein
VGAADPECGHGGGWFGLSQAVAGQQLDFRVYPGLDHLSLVAADSPLTPILVAWARDRLAGKPAPTTC